MRRAPALLVGLCLACGGGAPAHAASAHEPREHAAPDMREHCAAAERDAAAVLARADAWVAAREAPVEGWADASAAMRTCAGVSTGAWIFLPVGASISERSGPSYLDPSESLTAIAYAISYDVTFLDTNGRRHAHERRRELLDGLESTGTATRVFATFDFDGDGADELVWTSSDWAFDELDNSLGLLTFRDGEVRDYPPTAGIAIDRLEDWDQDGRLDLVTSQEVWPHIVYEGDPVGDEIGPPAVLFHSRADGTFSARDEVAARFLREQCPSRPEAIALFSDDPQIEAARAITCMRVWGASAADVRAELARALGDADPMDELGYSLEDLESFVEPDPPQVLTDSVDP